MNWCPLIKSHGPEVSRIALVGDYPTEDEVNSGQALTGSIERFIRRFGIKPDNTFRTLFIKQAVPGLGSKSRKIQNAALKHINISECRGILSEELSSIKPNVVVPMGELALNIITRQKSINKWRGSVLPVQPEMKLPETTKAIPTVHYRDVMKDPTVELLTRIDFQRVLKYEHILQFPQPDYKIWIARTAQALRGWWERSRTAPLIVFDIETYINGITCIGFSTDGKEAVTVPLISGLVDATEQVIIWKLVAEILASNIPKCNQNIYYDWWYLKNWGFTVNNIIADTLLIAHTLYPELPKKLGFLTSVYTEIPYFKDEGRDFSPLGGNFEQLLLYNAKDCIATQRVYIAQQKELDEFGLKSFYYDFVQKLLPQYERLGRRGILVNSARRQELLARYEYIRDDLQAQLNSLYNISVNVNPSKNLNFFLLEVLKVVNLTSTEEETVEDYCLNRTDNKLIQTALRLITAIRKINKLVDFLNFNIHSDNRLRCQYKIYGTKSGRTSGEFTPEQCFKVNKEGKIEGHDYGWNFQTIPKHGFKFAGERYGTDIRSMFIPTPGYTFIETDSAQAEARVVCVLSEDFETLELMDKIDLHIKTALICLNLSQEEWDALALQDKKDFRQDFGKVPRHAGNYDMEAYRMSLIIHKPVSVCQPALNRFHDFTPKIRMIFHAGVRQALDKGKNLQNPNGRRRDFFKRITTQVYKEAYSYIPQGTVSDNTKKAMLLTQEYFDNKYGPQQDNVFFLAESHDGLLSEVRYGFEEEYKEIIITNMQQPINFKRCTLSRDFNLIIPTETKVSKENWGELQ